MLEEEWESVLILARGRDAEKWGVSVGATVQNMPIPGALPPIQA